MIDKESLRIGNKVSLAHESNNPIVTVKELGEFEVGFEEEKEYGVYAYDLLVPIPLTPSLVEKCGLNERFFKSYEIKPLGGDGNKGQYGLFIKGKWEATRLRYLHQLQNLIFSLTNTELTLKSI